MSPALLSDGRVVIAGKADVAYLLDASHLGGIGGQRARLDSVCSADVDGGGAVVGTTVYLPCLAGTVALSAASPGGLGLAWSASAGGGPPVVAAGRVWTIGQDGTLYGLDPASGAVVQRAPIGVPANHFPTPGFGAGLLLATSAYRVVAFAAPVAASPATRGSTVPPPVTTTVPTRPTRPGRTAVVPAGVAERPSGRSAVVAAVVAGAATVAAAAVGWLEWRSRRRRPGPEAGG
jgi:hypothetical protein